MARYSAGRGRSKPRGDAASRAIPIVAAVRASAPISRPRIPLDPGRANAGRRAAHPMYGYACQEVARLLRLMLSQVCRTKRGKAEGATRWIATTGCFTGIDIPAHEVSPDQGTYDAGILCRGGAARLLLQVDQESQLLSRQIHCSSCSPPDAARQRLWRATVFCSTSLVSLRILVAACFTPLVFPRQDRLNHGFFYHRRAIRVNEFR
jgi:hypothetical protein